MNLRTPPHSEEAEAGVLGSVLIDPARMDDLTLSASDFYDRRNAVLWEQLCEMHVNNRPLDAITVGEHLKDLGLLDKVGGYDYMLKLQDETLVSAHSQHYADIVREKAQLRDGIGVLSDGIERLYAQKDDAQAIKCDVMSALATFEEEPDKDMADLCEDFVQDCKDGKVGQFNWWCPEWTEKIGRMSSELTILHAPRSTGKTAMMLQWITESHRTGGRTPLASIEMLKKELSSRFVANVGQVSTYTMRVRGSVTPDEADKSAEAIKEIRALKLCIRDKAMTIDDIRSWALREKKRGLDALFIDNLLSISDGGKQYQSKTIMYDDFIRKLRDLRDILKVPIILLAHPNAEGSIAWSKDVENFADIIIYIHNVPDEGIKIGDKHIMPRVCRGQHAVAKFQKNRNGISPVAHLDFIGSTQTFVHMDWV